MYKVIIIISTIAIIIQSIKLIYTLKKIDNYDDKKEV